MEGTGVHKRPVRPQSFLLSPKARTLNHREIASLSEEQAVERFKAIRFAENQGEPYCPHCGCVAVYTYKSRPIFKCQGCEKQFSLTSGTVFSHRKMPIRDILYAIAEFIEGAKGVSAMSLQRKLQCEYRTAWVLEHKLREAMSRDIGPQQLSGTVEFDGTLVGGYLKPRNAKKSKNVASGMDLNSARKLPSNIGGKKLCVFVTRERGPGGRIRTTILRHEAEAKPFILATVSETATLHSDSASSFDELAWKYAHYHRINHSEHYWTPESNTNHAENYFSMLKRGMRGVYHHIAHPAYVHAYAEEMAWRLANRCRSNLDKFNALVRSATTPRETRFKGMWQRGEAGREIVHLC